MKTLCLVLSLKDRRWIIDYYQKYQKIEEIVIVGPNFEAQYLLSTLDLPYKSYEEWAWNLNYNYLYDTAREKSYSWQFIEELHSENIIDSIKDFHGYPLLTMLQPNLMLPLYEVLQARAFIRQIIEKECPDKLVFHQRQNPFDEQFNRYFILTGSNGLERECAKNIANERNITIVEIANKEEGSVETLLISQSFLKLRQKAYTAITQPQLIPKEISRLKQIYNYHQSLKIQSKAFKKIKKNRLKKPTILMYVWGGYYLEYFENIIDLLQDIAHFVVVIVGEDEIAPTLKFIRKFRQRGVCIFGKNNWEIPEEKTIIDQWQAKVKETISRLTNNETLANYFVDEYGSYYHSFAFPILEKELSYTVPKTVLDLLRTELINEFVQPDLVISHFSIYPSEACDVLPARKHGIPTITLEHGITATTESVRDSFSTEFIAVAGEAYQKVLSDLEICSKDKVIPVGDVRLENLSYQQTIKDARSQYNLSVDQPLVIFCDCSGWTHDGEARHSTWKSVQEMLSLKKYIPDIQIIYRVHHGTDYSVMQKYFDQLNIPDIIFQISPEPLFVDIVQAADLVIAHRTSAITEALLMGVPVIYLCALSRKEPMYLNCEAIKVAESFEKIPVLVKEILAASWSREEVLDKVKPYFEQTIFGNDGYANERFKNLILKLLNSPKSEKQEGFQDWLDRVERCCKIPIENLSYIVQ